MAIICNAIGIIGVAFILTAFFLLEHGTFKSHDRRYLFLNLFGSLFIIVSLLQDWNLPSFTINTLWVVISIYGMLKSIKTNARLYY